MGTQDNDSPGMILTNPAPTMTSYSITLIRPQHLRGHLPAEFTLRTFFWPLPDFFVCFIVLVCSPNTSPCRHYLNQWVSSSRQLIGHQLQQQQRRERQVSDRNGSPVTVAGTAPVCTSPVCRAPGHTGHTGHTGPVTGRQLRTAVAHLRVSPHRVELVGWVCGGATTMLGAVKMEGHEHPDWSGSGYYGETEVRAHPAGWVWAHRNTPDRGWTYWDREERRQSNIITSRINLRVQHK